MTSLTKVSIGLLTAGSLVLSHLALAGPNYDVVNIEGEITIDGVVDEQAWQNVPVIEGSFHFPWQTISAPTTTFRAGADGDFFYFSFVSIDADIIVLDESIGERETVDVEDRVELFFAPSAIDEAVDYALPTYYGVEIDSVGRVHDYSMVYYRQIDSEWGFKTLETVAQTTETGYIVEAKIAISELKELGLLNEDNEMMTGAYRAEFSKGASDTDMKWISWVDPETAVPDFHVQSSFGNFRFVD